MEEALFGALVGAGAGALLGAGAGIVLARMQERHRVRVTILREVLPHLGYSTYSHSPEYVERVSELVTLAVVLRKRERSKAAEIFRIYEEREKTAHLPGAVNDEAASVALRDKHEVLIKRWKEAMGDIRLELSNHLRWGKLSEVEETALKQ